MSKKVIVIGAGLGGMAAAIACASMGMSVTILEKNNKPGGKCNLKILNGYTFDLGPSILILPENFRALFSIAGEKLADYVKLIPLSLHWRNFFEDGVKVDLFSEIDRTQLNIENLFPSCGLEFMQYVRYSFRQLNILRNYLSGKIENLGDALKYISVLDLFKLDIHSSMHKVNSKLFSSLYLRDIFDYFIKYVGSSAYDAPAFMNLLSAAQYSSGLWYVKGGIYNLVRGCEKLMKKLGVDVRYNCEVVSLQISNNRIKKVFVAGGEFYEPDAVISNMEIIPFLRQFIRTDERKINQLERKYSPSCSGLVIHLGLDKIYKELAHHNFFFSKDQKQHFTSIFRDFRLPEDPTVYVVAPTRTDPQIAPAGCDVIKVLPHIPHIQLDYLYTRDQYEKYSELVMDKLERMGLKDLRKHIVVQDMWTPFDIESKYYSNRGSIYGVITDRHSNFGFKAPRHLKKYDNLFFAGGSVNPGGGMPMVIMSGMQAAIMAKKL